MNRDYAKRHAAQKKIGRWRSPVYLWLTLLLLFSALVSGLLMLHKYYYHGRNVATLRPLSNNPVSRRAAPVVEVAKVATIPKFDFYNISPEEQEKKLRTKTAYELKIAVMDDFAAADRLKAELALLGFAASIFPIYQHNIQKYEISVGPYASEDKANADRQKLKLNKLESVVRVLRR